jgi:SynChlorMet cassette protein ScmC
MIHHINALRGGLPIHAASVELNGTAVLLAARGGTGKSTCCRRFPKNWNVLGDDEALLVKESEGYIVHPMPTWSHYQEGGRDVTWKTESATSVQAIFFLEQAQVDEAISISSSESGWRFYSEVYPIYRMFWQGSGEEEKRQINTMLFHNACDAGLRIPAFILRVSRYGRFWEQIEHALEQVGNDKN